MIKLGLPLAALAAVIGMGLYSWGLSSKLDLAQSERDTARKNSAAFEQSLITERQSKARAEQLNATYLEDLRNAKNEIDELRNNVERGTGELHVNAECPEPRSVSSATASIGKPDATAPRLSESAQRNYFLLRERHAEAINQILGLQAYITEFCSNKKPAN